MESINNKMFITIIMLALPGNTSCKPKANVEPTRASEPTTANTSTSSSSSGSGQEVGEIQANVGQNKQSSNQPVNGVSNVKISANRQVFQGMTIFDNPSSQKTEWPLASRPNNGANITIEMVGGGLYGGKIQASDPSHVSLLLTPEEQILNTPIINIKEIRSLPLGGVGGGLD